MNNHHTKMLPNHAANIDRYEKDPVSWLRKVKIIERNGRTPEVLDH